MSEPGQVDPGGVCSVRPRPSPGAVHNLPLQLTSFVGRKAELAELGGVLAGTRLLTLIGSGGCGKTRLALQVAEASAAGYPGGVVVTELAPVADPAGVATAVAHALGLKDEPSRPRIDSIADRLSTGRTLLLLDNCEHLVDACAALVSTLLLRCPELSVLATSREPLDVGGETGWRVPGLSLPARAPASPAQLNRSEAVQLFGDRARRVRSTFVVDEGNAAAVAEICCRLEGIPLAIELAAARVRILSPGQIAAGLVEAFRLLTGGGRTAVARQRTLRASVDWSHSLLTEPERVLLRRLAPFAGLFDLAAAEAVAAGAGLAPHQVLDQLTLLVDKSLVDRADTGNGAGDGDEARFRLLDTMRQYAAEHLVAGGEDDDVRRRHRDHFLDGAEALSHLAVGSAQESALHQLSADLDNLREAFSWSQRAGEPDGALRIATALAPVWRMRGRRVEGSTWLDEALETPGPAGAYWRVRALTARTRIEWNMLDPAAPDRVDECVRQARELGDPALLARALVGGGSYLSRGPHRHREMLTEAVDLADALGDAESLVDAKAWLAIMTVLGGEPDVAGPRLAEVTTLAVGHGDLYVARACRGFSGLALLMRGDVGPARALTAAATSEAEALGDRKTSMQTLAYLAWAAGLAGEEDVARDAWARSQVTVPAAGDNVHELFAQLGIGMAALSVGDVGAAEDAFGRGWALAGGSPGVGDLFLGPWAEAELACGDLAVARARADVAVARTAGLPWQEGWALAARARVAFADGDPGQAETLARRSLMVRHRIGDRGGIAASLELLAVVGVVQRSLPSSARLFGAAAAMRAAAGCGVLGIHRDAVDSAVAAARDALGSSSFDRGHAEGAALSGAGVVAYVSRGHGGRKRPRQGWASLTPAELDVVGLLTAGLTNKEIAARLFVSPRTVHTHLSHVYAKLSVHSRLQLAQEAARNVDPGEGK